VQVEESENEQSIGNTLLLSLASQIHPTPQGAWTSTKAEEPRSKSRVDPSLVLNHVRHCSRFSYAHSGPLDGDPPHSCSLTTPGRRHPAVLEPSAKK
jgi:hypothetical protein